MTFKHILLTMAASCALQLSTFAQSARSVLDQTASVLQHSGGIEATFEGTQFKGQKAAGIATGRIELDGNKFKITSDALTTWFDGHTQWTLMTGSDEVNVSTPSAGELQHINPYAFINLYKQGYTLSLNESSYKGKSCHEVRMKAQSGSNSIQLLVATIDKSTHLPLSVRIKDHKGQWTRIRVSGIRTHRKWNVSNFRFNAKQHPGIEVIDLR